MPMIIIGLVLIGVGVYMLFQVKRSAGDALEIQAQGTKTIPEVKEILSAMADVDPNYREMVEVKGFAQASQPVKAPYSGMQVAFYTAETVQVSETTEEYTDNDGNRRTRTNKHNDKLSEEESGAQLLLKDNEGNEIVIETNGIANKLDLQKTLDRFERDDPFRGDRYYQNSHRRYRHYDIAGPRGGYGYQVLGYKQVENTIPLNAPLYALGEAYMSGGKIFIGPPRDKSKPFIITTKSEEQLLKSKNSSKISSIAFGAIGFIVGIILLIKGIIG